MSWSVTFYYEQELRSAFMNNLLKGLIRPGVYNINAFLHTKNYDSAPGQQGIWLTIKRGTMLVFSNNYRTVGGNLVKDNTRLGNYVVKCVADADLEYRLAEPTGNFSEAFLPSGTDPSKPQAPILFVVASFVYDPDAEGMSSPVFSFAVPDSNPEITSPSEHIPNEDKTATSLEADTDVSYLLIGTVLDNQRDNIEYAEGGANNWRQEGNYNGEISWIRNHVFTAKGLPDYSGQLSQNYGSNMSSLIFMPEYNKVRLTPGRFYFNSILYNIAGLTWKRAYGQGQPITSTIPSSTNGWLVDHSYNASGDSNFTYSFLDISTEESKLVIDFLFLAVKTAFNRSTTTNLSGLMDNTITRRTIPFRLVCDAPAGMDLDTKTCVNSALGLGGTLIVPLDNSIVNINRLKDIINNRDIILPVIDHMRQHYNEPPFLSPENGESLIPLMIAFRHVNSEGDGFTDYQSHTFDSMEKADETTPAPAINPANILTFLDLQSTSFAIIGAHYAAEEVFNTVPFLD